MQLVFHLQPRRFPSDQGKIPYVIAKFRGTPLNAIRPYLAPEEGDQPEWLEFDYLERNYGDPDDAERRLHLLLKGDQRRRSSPSSSKTWPLR